MTTLFAASPGDAQARGRELGAVWREKVQETWRTYQGIFASYDLPPTLARDVAEGSLTAVTKWAPYLADEIAGLALGAELETWQVAALNARSEVLARYRAPIPGECSTSVFLPDGEAPRTLQTWDWHEGLEGLTLVWQFEPRPGHTVKTFTELGLLGKIGVNSAGLGVHFNLLQHDADGEGYGVPVHLLARRILDEATDLAEAEAIVRSATVSASVALTVVTSRAGTSSAATFEVSPAGVRRVDASPDGVLCHTNHFLDPELALGERLAPNDPDTYARQSRLLERSSILQSADVARRAEAMVSHDEDGAGLCAHPGTPGDITARGRTLITIALDVEKGRLIYRDGNPCTAPADAWVEV